MSWKPIKTAPKDGPPLLLWDPYYLMRIGRWETAKAAAIYGRSLSDGQDGHWMQDLPYGDDPGRGEIGKSLSPSHWQYLPLPPKV